MERPLRTPWTNVYGLSRAVLATGTLATIALNPASLFGTPEGMLGIPVLKLSLFHMLNVLGAEPTRWLAMAILSMVIVGWRPRWTGVLHWWVTWSVAVSCLVPDGGDQVAAVLTAFLIPVTLTDHRRFHWQACPQTDGALALVVAVSSLWAARVQMALIYFDAVVEKLHSTEWMNGTALYYWFTHPSFGVPDTLRPLVVRLLSHASIVATLTWSVLLLEVLLFASLFMERRWWRWLLLAGLAFHSAIWFVHGLGSFFFSMAGGLILYLRPVEDFFDGLRFRSWISRRLAPILTPLARGQEP